MRGAVYALPAPAAIHAARPEWRLMTEVLALGHSRLRRFRLRRSRALSGRAIHAYSGSASDDRALD